VNMYFKERGWEDVDWIQLTRDMAQWRDLVNTVMNLRDPYWGGGVFLDFSTR